jgi:hypothetical protein
MTQHSLDAADLDAAGLLRLLERCDPAGVLSIFADAVPGERGTEIDVRNRLAELERRVAAEGPPERAELLSVALAERAADIGALWNPAEAGRGRALFIPLGGGAPTRFASRLSVPNRVVLDDRPFVHPLLECLERGRPAAVALLSGADAELLEWRDGELLLLARLVEEPEAPRGRPGPLVAAGHHQTTPLRERRERRARDRRRRMVEQGASALGELAAERRWERAVVSGGQALTAPLIRALPAPLRSHAIRDGRHLIDMENAAVARVVGELLEEQQSAWDARLTQRIRDAALAGRGGALGLSEVIAALNDARVEHLVYDPAIRYTGAIAADGRLLAPPEQHPLGTPSVAEPRLTERIVERCLATGARVTPVTGPAVDTLAEMGGLAARVRW